VKYLHRCPLWASAIAAFAPYALAQDDAAPSSRLHFSASVDVTTAYFFRGFLQEDQGFIIQPAAGLTVDVLTRDGFTLSTTVGTWNSIHSEATGAASTDTSVEHWYESDVYASLTASWDEWTLDATYVWYLSPSDAFETIQELILSASFDDSEHLGAWAMSPSITLGFETGSNYSDGADSDRGIFLGLAVAPGFETMLGESHPLSITFPLEVGLSLDDYYQDASGDDDFFGYASVGVRFDTDIPLSEAFGAWSTFFSVNALFLGDNLDTVNNDDSFELIATVGISLAF
jgi:hypothetical protein